MRAPGPVSPRCSTSAPPIRAAAGPAAPALAAPTGSGSAADTISSLEADGNRVIVNRQGDDRILEATGHVVFVDVK